MRHSRKPRLTLAGFFIWVLIISVSFGVLRLAFLRESWLLLVVGADILVGSAIAMVIYLQKCWRGTLFIVGLLMSIYVGTYLVLTLNGRYEAEVWGAAGPKVYRWEPLYFVEGSALEMKSNDGVMLTFLPLYYLDLWLWHKDDGHLLGKYPYDDRWD